LTGQGLYWYSRIFPETSLLASFSFVKEVISNVSSNIQQALGQLFQTLEHLEAAAGRQEHKAMQIQQQDLFNTRASNGNGNGKVNGKKTQYAVDPALLAQRLDVAIEKIEQVLREG
jgi:hypothetical protein